MKKIVSITLVLLILMTTVTAFAKIDEKLSNHWSKGLIQKDFVAYYFPYLAKDSFNKFNPNEYILKKDFALSLASLSKDYDLIQSTNNIGIYESLNRGEVVELIGKKLIEIDELKIGNKELPFKDINTMNKESIELLRVLYNLGIINGVSEKDFAPNNKLTQAEAIIILQRVKEVLEGMKEVAFNITGIVQSYNNQESIIVKEEKDKVLVTLTKEFPTPGYGLGVEKIVVEENGYRIYLDITPPKEGSMQLQVITYKTMTIEIEKKALKQSLPYTFYVEGIESNLLK